MTRFIAALPGLLLLASVVPYVAPPAAAQPQTNEVSMTGNAFVPNLITVLIGTTVTWTNEDPEIHSVTSDAGQVQTFDRDPIAPAAVSPTGLNKANVTFDTLGIISYHCKHHNMVGRVQVVASIDVEEIMVKTSLGNVFDPDFVDINASAKVTFMNHDDRTHDVLFENGTIGNLGDIDAMGASVSYQFDTPGGYRYRCTYHSTDFEAGMVGKISVGGAIKFPPTITVTSPTPGQTVGGRVNITGTAEAGLGNVSVLRVSVRIGANTTYAPANLTTNGPGVAWTYVWDAAGSPDGEILLSVFAEGELNSSVVSFGVVVSNPPTGATGKKGGIPGPDAALILAGVAALACARRRRG